MIDLSHKQFFFLILLIAVISFFMNVTGFAANLHIGKNLYLGLSPDLPVLSGFMYRYGDFFIFFWAINLLSIFSAGVLVISKNSKQRGALLCWSAFGVAVSFTYIGLVALGYVNVVSKLD